MFIATMTAERRERMSHDNPGKFMLFAVADIEELVSTGKLKEAAILLADVKITLRCYVANHSHHN